MKIHRFIGQIEDKEITRQIQTTPKIKELLQSSLPLNEPFTLKWEEVRLVIADSLMHKKFDQAFYYLCAAYDQSPSEKTKQNIISLATLLHPSTVFHADTFKTQACQKPLEWKELTWSPQEMWLAYAYVWQSFF